jgi:ATP/maltotriose-dependent transcriptional regulator MalT
MQVLTTSIGVPRLPDDAIARPRLLERLRQGLSRRLILIAAEAGYGKSTLATQFTRTLPWPVAWHTTTEADRDPAALLAAIIAGIETARPGTTLRAPEVLGAITGAEASWHQAADALINDLAEAQADLLLVLDDIHIIADGASSPIPGYLASHLPACARLVLITRSTPTSGEIARLIGQGQVVVLDSQDLAFTHSETSAFLAGTARAPISAEHLHLIQARTEGWPVALRLLAQAAQADGGEVTVHAIQRLFSGRHALYTYFATQVLERLPPDRCRFLIQVSVLDPLEAEVCAAATGREDAGALLRDLERDGCFLTSLGTRRDAYRLHPLFREVLRSYLERQESADLVCGLLRTAGRHLAAHGRAEEAIPYLLKARDHDEVVRVLAAAGMRLVHEGRGAIVSQWIHVLPEEVLARSAALLTLLGYLANLRGQWDEALRRFQAAAAQSDGDDRGVASYGAASMLARLGRFDEAIAVCEDALRLAGLSDRTRGSLLRRLGACESFKGRPHASAVLYEGALRHFEAAGDGLGQAQVLHELVYLGSQMQPEPGWSAPLLQRLMALRHRVEGLGMRADVAQAIGQLLIEDREFARALEFLDEAGQAARLLDDVFRLGINYLYRGLALLGQGRTEAARAVLEEGLRMPVERQITFDVHYMRVALAQLAWREGRPQRAVAELRTLLAEARHRQVPMDIPPLQVILGLAAVDAGLLDDAARHLLEAREGFAGWRADRRVAECNLYVAALAHRRGEGGESPGLVEVLTDARRHALDPLFEEHAGLLAPLLTAALARGVEEDYVAGLLIRAGKAAHLAPVLAAPDAGARVRAVRTLAGLGTEDARLLLAGASKDADESVRAAAREALLDLSRQPPLPLAIRMFGGFEVRRSGRLLPSAAWVRRRDRLLFCYLLLQREPVPREVLQDALWPDLEPSSAAASLRVAWSRLKRALEPGLPGRLPSSYLTTEGGRYGLRWTAIETDVHQFDEAVSHAGQAATPEERVTRLQSAAALYRGDFLPDDADEPWTVVERERLRSLYLGVLLRLAEEYERTGRSEDAAAALRGVLRHEPWREEAYCGLMRALARLGRRSEALHLYRECQALLQQELGVSPAAETTALFEAIVADRLV